MEWVNVNGSRTVEGQRGSCAESLLRATSGGHNVEIRFNVPLMSDVSHEERTVELNAARWEPGAILEVARIDLFYIQRLHLPYLRSKRNSVEVLALAVTEYPVAPGSKNAEASASEPKHDEAGRADDGAPFTRMFTAPSRDFISRSTASAVLFTRKSAR